VVVFAIAVTSALHGALSDRFGRKRVMVTACALLAMPTLLCATATSFRTLLAFRALQGVLVPGVSAVAVAWLGDEYPGAELGRKVGLFIAASVAGGLLGRVLSGLVAEWISWHAPFVVFGLLTLAGAVLMAKELPSPPPHVLAGAGSPLHALRHFANPRLLGAFVSGGAAFFGFIGIFTYLPYHLTAPPYRLGTSAVSSLYLAYLAGIFTSLLTEPFVKRHGERAVIAAGFAIAIVGAAATAIPSVAAVAIALLVLCVGMFAVQSTAPAFVNREAKSGKGAAGALYVSFYYGGATLGAFLPGHALEAWGWTGVLGACVAAFAVGMLADLVLCR
jgi:YNFM family putative membrane transporter